MPEYKFHNKETNEEWTEWMSISERTKFLADNPHIEQLVYGAPAVTYRAGQRTKPDDGFRDVLREVKKKHGRRANVNTF